VIAWPVARRNAAVQRARMMTGAPRPGTRAVPCRRTLSAGCSVGAHAVGFARVIVGVHARSQRGNTPCVPSQPVLRRPSSCAGVRTGSGSSCQRRCSAVSVSGCTGRVDAARNRRRATPSFTRQAMRSRLLCLIVPMSSPRIEPAPLTTPRSARILDLTPVRILNPSTVAADRRA